MACTTLPKPRPAQYLSLLWCGRDIIQQVSLYLSRHSSVMRMVHSVTQRRGPSLARAKALCGFDCPVIRIVAHGLVSDKGSVKYFSSPISCVVMGKTYLLPRKAQTPQFPHEISWGSRSLRSHLRLRNLFSPGSRSISNSPRQVLLTHSISRSMSYCV